MQGDEPLPLTREEEATVQELDDMIESTLQQIRYETQRTHELEQQFIVEDNINVDRTIEQLKHSVRNITEAHVVIRQLFDMLVQTRKSSTERKQKLLAAEAQSKSLTEQVEGENGIQN